MLVAGGGLSRDNNSSLHIITSDLGRSDVRHRQTSGEIKQALTLSLILSDDIERRGAPTSVILGPLELVLKIYWFLDCILNHFARY